MEGSYFKVVLFLKLNAVQKNLTCIFLRILLHLRENMNHILLNYNFKKIIFNAFCGKFEKILLESE